MGTYSTIECPHCKHINTVDHCVMSFSCCDAGELISVDGERCWEFRDLKDFANLICENCNKYVFFNKGEQQ